MTDTLSLPQPDISAGFRRPNPRLPPSESEGVPYCSFSACAVKHNLSRGTGYA